jgi:hypothetical protein
MDLPHVLQESILALEPLLLVWTAIVRTHKWALVIVNCLLMPLQIFGVVERF